MLSKMKLLIRFLIWKLKKDYGANCEIKDTDDFPELKGEQRGRCPSCRCKETIEFLENYL